MKSDLAAPELATAMATYRDLLRAQRDVLNRLNVYPVPDGDTGTNMLLTMESVVDSLPDAGSMREVCEAIGHSSLMGARGNSGVILSQILRGLVETLSTTEMADGHLFARALEAGSDEARKAVHHPVEGTILTVAAAAAAAATSASAGSGDLSEVLPEARRAAAEALSRTPEQLQMLATAGVVDAGASGYVLMLDGITGALGGEIPALDLSPSEMSRLRVAEPTSVPQGVSSEAGPEPSPSGRFGYHRYEVMLFLHARDEDVPGLRQAWSRLGESIAVVGGSGLWNCHVHTDDIGAAIEAAIEVGRPERIRVSDLADEVQEEAWVRQAEAASSEAGLTANPPLTTVVALCDGEGICEIFRSLGAVAVMRPQLPDETWGALLEKAVERVPAQSAVLVTNGPRLLDIARNATRTTSKEVVVLETVNVCQGIAAVCSHDPESTLKENLASMTEASKRVLTGSVSQAFDPAGGGVPAPGEEWVASTSDRMSVVYAEDAVAAGCAILAKLLRGDHELVTLVVGEQATLSEAAAVAAWLARRQPEVVVETHEGGQPGQAFVFSVE